MSDSVALRANPNVEGLGVAAAAGGMGSQNPMQFLDTMQQMQQRSAAVRQLNAQFEARGRAGQIIASAPDFESGLEALQRDPLVAGRAPDIIGSYRSTQHIMTQMQGAQLGQNRDAMEMVMKMASAATTDPQSLDKLLKAGMAGLPPEVRQRVTPAIASFRDALLTDLPPGKEALPAYQNRFQGILMGSGMTPDAYASLVGKPGTIPLGNRTIGTLERPGQPIQQTGSFAMGAQPRLDIVNTGGEHQGVFLSDLGNSGPVGPAMPNTIAPSYQMTPVPGMPGTEQPSIVSRQGVQALGALGGPPTGPGAGLTFQGADGQPTGNALGVSPPRTASPEEKAAGTARGTVQGQLPTLVEKEYRQHAGMTAKDIQEEVNSNAIAIPRNVPRLDNLIRSIGEFQAGGAAGFRTNIGQMAQGLRNIGLDISPETIDKIANGSLTYSQFFDANIRPYTVEVLKAAAQGTGRVMRSEVEAFMNSVSKETDPRAILEILNQARQQMSIHYAEAEMWPQFRQRALAKDPTLGGLELQDFPIYVAKNLNLDKLPSQTGGGIQLGPVRAQGARGAEGARPPPQLNEVVNGFRYKGGPVRDQKSWEKAE